MPFIDRANAGRRLAQQLLHLQGSDAVALGLPRGGVPVAFEVARALGIPLDIIVVRKLGVPFQPELGMGAIGEGGVRVINDEVVRAAGVSDAEIAAVEARERAELERRARLYRGDRARVSLEGRTAIVIDDGVATGSTARAACQVARASGAARVVLAAPVAPPSTIAGLSLDADDVVCVQTPEIFFAIGEWYADFAQVADGEVAALLERASKELSTTASTPPVAGNDAVVRNDEVEVQAGPARLRGHFTLPDGATGMVVFAHGSGSSRHSPRNRFVADILNEAALGTLLFDLLTPAEEDDRAKVFDIELLSTRLVEVTAWLKHQAGAGDLTIGYFGASTGAAAALWAAADPGAEIGAVVSRGGRPDLAWPRLSLVRAPTLLIVGGHDEVVLELNRHAQAQLSCESQLVVVPGATHLFEEPGTLASAAEHARDWFLSHLAPVKQPG